MSATAHVPPTTIAVWSPSTNADPARRKNRDATETDECDADGVTITHFAVFDVLGTTQKTDWTAIPTARQLDAGKKISVAADSVVVTLT